MTAAQPNPHSRQWPGTARIFANVQTDIFAFGTSLFFIVTCGMPFPDLNPVEGDDEIERRSRAEKLPRLEIVVVKSFGAVGWARTSAEDVVRDRQNLERS